MSQLESLMKDHFIEYASYFILDRAIPELRDGLKPVQRRILHTLHRMNDGLYATFWERMRTAWTLESGGPDERLRHAGHRGPGDPALVQGGA